MVRSSTRSHQRRSRRRRSSPPNDTATLEGIGRRLDRLEIAVNDKLTEHAAVLADHRRRMSALEQQRPG